MYSGPQAAVALRFAACPSGLASGLRAVGRGFDLRCRQGRCHDGATRWSPTRQRSLRSSASATLRAPLTPPYQMRGAWVRCCTPLQHMRTGVRKTSIARVPMRRRPARCRARARSPAAFPVRCSAGPVPRPPSCGQQRTLPTPSPGQPGRRATASPCRATP
jgi:hypothetical protein